MEIVAQSENSVGFITKTRHHPKTSDSTTLRASVEFGKAFKKRLPLPEPGVKMT